MAQGADPTPESNAGEGQSTGSNMETNATTRELMNEVTGLLKSMRMTGPQVRMVTIRSIRSGEQAEVLLDGGATHCLREARSKAEWEKGTPTQVQLASGSVEMRMNPPNGNNPSAGPGAAHHPGIETHGDRVQTHVE